MQIGVGLLGSYFLLAVILYGLRLKGEERLLDQMKGTLKRAKKEMWTFLEDVNTEVEFRQFARICNNG